MHNDAVATYQKKSVDYKNPSEKTNKDKPIPKHNESSQR